MYYLLLSRSQTSLDAELLPTPAACLLGKLDTWLSFLCLSHLDMLQLDRIDNMSCQNTHCLLCCCVAVRRAYGDRYTATVGKVPAVACTEMLSVAQSMLSIFKPWWLFLAMVLLVLRLMDCQHRSACQMPHSPILMRRAPWLLWHRRNTMKHSFLTAALTCPVSLMLQLAAAL